jgi:pimeloyl-ACP methyl ester carboxylesterase
MSQLMQSFALNAISPTDLARIMVPTTLIWGRHDLATPLDVALSASARYGWPLHIIEKANDDPPVEQPDAVVKTLLAVLDAAKAPADHKSVAGSEKGAGR